MNIESSSVEVKFASLGKYILGKTLGSGFNSKVKLGYDPSTDQYFAVKIIKRSHPNIDLKALRKEVETLNSLKHSNIVNMVEFLYSADYVKKNGKSYKVVALVLELVSGGEVFDYVKISGRFSEEVARIYFRILIETLEHCHQNGTAHRDLKLENLLFDENFNLKIADFGYATSIRGKNGSGKLHTILGTESYMAPEIHAGKAYSGTAVDIFACGVILFIMISGNPPFLKADPKCDSYYKLFKTNEQFTFWNAHMNHMTEQVGQEGFYSEEFIDLMNGMFAYNPQNRPTIEQIKAHPWYNGPIADIQTLKAEFYERRVMVEEEIRKQREANKETKLMAKLQNNQQNFSGYRPYY